MKRGFQALSVALLLGGAVAQSLTDLTASEAAEAIKSGKITSRALVEALLKKADQYKSLNAFITLNAAGALAAADKADAAVKAGGTLGALHGVPIVIKDNINTAGIATSGGTPALKTFIPEKNAPVVQKLLDAGAIVLGKTNLHELAFGITSNNSAFGAVGNPYNSTLFAGGSSGGTGAAVSGRIAPAGLGTDTGGSVRIPAAVNGIVGLRPTSGRYSGAGIIPLSKTRDTAGPMARTVADLAMLDGIITGNSNLPEVNLNQVTLGVPKQLAADLDPETARLFDNALSALKQAGAAIVEVDFANILDLTGKSGFPIVFYETKRDMAAYLKRYKTGKTIEQVAQSTASPDVNFVLNNIVLGKDATPESVYKDAMQVRKQLVKAYATLFKESGLTALVFPTTPLPAQPIASSDANVTLNGKSVPTFNTFIRNTDSGSVAGIPGLSLPMGITKEGLPVGLELDSPAKSDRSLLALGQAVEKLMPKIPAP